MGGGTASEKFELMITRRPNYSGLGLRSLPINRPERERLSQMLVKIESAVHNKQSMPIEDMRDILTEVSQLQFEFPRHKLEALFEVVNEKLHSSIECENIYCIEVLLECLRLMSARNVKAEQKYSELSLVAQGVARDVMRVLNMDPRLDDNELNQLLDGALSEAKRIGMRGEVIDVAITLKMMRNNLLQEMQSRAAQSEEEDGDALAIGAAFEEDKSTNVYDDKFDQYVDMPLEELGLTSEVEANLGVHPYNTNYIVVANLTVNYIRKNLKEA